MTASFFVARFGRLLRIPLWQEFLYDRKAQEFIDIGNNSKPLDEILSIPI
ncbi:hypothetical protein ACLUXI_06435 [Bifidobacterium apri]